MIWHIKRKDYIYVALEIRTHGIEQRWLVFGLSVRNLASSKTGIHTQPVLITAVGHLLSRVTFDRLYTPAPLCPMTLALLKVQTATHRGWAVSLMTGKTEIQRP